MKFALKSLDDLSCSNPSGVRNEISDFLPLPTIHIIWTFVLFEGRTLFIHKAFEFQPGLTSLIFWVCSLTSAWGGSPDTHSAHDLQPPPLFLFSGLNFDQSFLRLGSRSEFIKQPTLPSYYWLAKWFVIWSNSFSMVGQRYYRPVHTPLTVS